ncbi:MAG: hypothetical protein ACT4P3_01370 [Betaproteobacteria bacterium]
MLVRSLVIAVLSRVAVIAGTALLAGCGTEKARVAEAPPADCRSQNDALIVPGCRIGPAHIGMTPAALLQALGQPNASRGPSANRITHDFRSRELSVSVSTLTNVVDKIYTYGTRYATTQGIRVGSSELEVSAKLGPPKWRNLQHASAEDGYANYCYPDATLVELGGPVAPDAGRVRSIAIRGCNP